MVSRTTLPMLVVLGLSAGCSDAPVAAESDGSSGDSSTTAENVSSTGADDTSVDESTTTGEHAESSSTSTGSEDTGSTDTDAPADPLNFELLVQREVSGDLHLFSYRVSDGVGEPLVRVHELDAGRDWTDPVFLSERRVLIEVDDPDGSELRVADLDAPSTTTRIDVATRPAGYDTSPMLLPDEGSLIYGRDGFMNRIVLDGMNPTQADRLIPYGGFRAAVDPQGRYIIVGAPDSESAFRLGLADMTATILPDSAFVPHLTMDGEAGFRSRDGGDGTRRLEYVPLGDTFGTPIDLLPEVKPGDLREYHPASDGVRPHPTRQGVAVTVGPPGDTTLHYVGIEDGAALPPVLLDGPEASGELHGPFAGSGWSPDGKWLGFEVYTEAGYEVWLADFGNGHDPKLTMVAPAGPQWWPEFIWAPDSSALYIGHPWSDVPPRVERVALDQGEPTVQPIGDLQSFPLALSPDGTELVFMHWEGDDASVNRSLYIVDVSGSEPAEPVLLVEGPTEGSVGDAVFSPDGRVLAYGRTDDTTHLMLASLDDLDQPHIEVTDAVQWWFTPSSQP